MIYERGRTRAPSALTMSKCLEMHRGSTQKFIGRGAA
jgi:hypothetical protein